MNTERPPRNSMPLKLLKSSSKSLSFRRRFKNKPVPHVQPNPNPEVGGTGEGTEGEESHSLVFPHDKGDDCTLDDLSKYAYSEAGDCKEPAPSHKAQQVRHNAMGASPDAVTTDELELPNAGTAETQAMDDCTYLEDHPCTLLRASTASLTSAVMEGSKETTTGTAGYSYSLSPSEDLNLVSLTSFSQDDILSAMAAEDSLNLQRERDALQAALHRSIMDQQQLLSEGQKMASQVPPEIQKDKASATATVTATAENNGSTEGTDPTTSNNNSKEDAEDSMEILFDPTESDNLNGESGLEVKLSDLEKSILQGQLKARNAEIDSPMHLKANKGRGSNTDIPAVLQEVFVPDHKRLQTKRRSKYSKSHSYKDIRTGSGKPPRHSSLSPFVLKRGNSVATGMGATSAAEQDSASAASSRIKTIGPREPDHDGESRDQSSAATQNAHRSVRRRSTSIREQHNSVSSSRVGAGEGSTSKASRSASKASRTSSRRSERRRAAAVSARRIRNATDRGSSHAMPKQPCSSHSNSTEAASVQRRSVSCMRSTASSSSRRGLIKRVKSAGCRMHCPKNTSQKSSAKEDTEVGEMTERNMTERDQTDGEFMDHVYNDIHYVMNEGSDEDAESEEEEDDDDNMTRKSIISRISSTFNRRLARRNLHQQHLQQEEPPQAVEQLQEEKQLQEEEKEDKRSRGRSGESGQTSRKSRSKSRRRRFARSISRSIRASFRRTKSRRSKEERRDKAQPQHRIEPGEMEDSSRLENGYMADISRMERHEESNVEEDHSDFQQEDSHQHDIVFDPGQIHESEKENSTPGSPSIAARSLMQGSSKGKIIIDVDELQEFRQRQRSEGKPRPNLAMAGSVSGRPSMEFSQDFTVVTSHHGHRQQQQQQQQRRSGNGGSDFCSNGSSRRQKSYGSMKAKSVSSGARRTRRGAESMERPKGPPNTRHNNYRRSSRATNGGGSSRTLGSEPQTPSVNNRRQMLLQARGRSGRSVSSVRSVRTMVTRDSKTDPRHVLFDAPTKRRSRSVEIWERRGSF